MERIRARVLIAHAKPLWRSGAAVALTRAGHDVVAEAHDPASLREATTAVDVIVCGLSLGLREVVSVVHRATATAATRVIVVEPGDEPRHLARAVRAGARGYVHDTIAPEELLRAIDAVLAGESVLPAELASRAFDELRRAGRPPAVPGQELLTSRELEVLRLLGTGMSYADIAVELDVAVRTVTNHAAHVMKKLGLHSRAELALHAARAERED